MFTRREQGEFKVFLNYCKIPNVENSGKLHASTIPTNKLFSSPCIENKRSGVQNSLNWQMRNTKFLLIKIYLRMGLFVCEMSDKFCYISKNYNKR
tara:strand:+ start:71 stop:355 length:285 start_codon:yes stop_codon:yes gene_type:complete